jgi:ParB-like chromosome segregation protein Spo0J
MQKMIPISKLRPSQATSEDRIAKCIALLRAGSVAPPLLVELRTDGLYVIHEGHHRFESAVRYGLTEVSCVLCDGRGVEIPVEARPPIPQATA